MNTTMDGREFCSKSVTSVTHDEKPVFSLVKPVTLFAAGPSQASRTKDPSPAEIAAACLEIRSGWTAEEHHRRMRVDLRPSFTRCDGERLEMSGDDYERHHSGRAELPGPFHPGQKPLQLGPRRIVDTVSKQTES